MKKGGGSESTIIVGPSKSVLVYALHSLEYVLGLARFRVFVPKLYYISLKKGYLTVMRFDIFRLFPVGLSHLYGICQHASDDYRT